MHVWHQSEFKSCCFDLSTYTRTPAPLLMCIYMDSISQRNGILSISCIPIGILFLNTDARHGKLGYHRGYCSSCCSIIWLSRNRCSNETNRKDEVNHQIKPISIGQVPSTNVYILSSFSFKNTCYFVREPSLMYPINYCFCGIFRLLSSF